MQVLRPARFLIAWDVVNFQDRVLPISDGWTRWSWEEYCAEYGWRPLYIVNIKPKGIEYER